MSQMPAHRVVQREVIAWANGLNGRAPVGNDLSLLIQTLADAVERDRNSDPPRQGDGVAERADWVDGPIASANVELLIESLVQAAAEYENNCDRLVAKTIRIQLEKAKQAIRDALKTAGDGTSNGRTTKPELTGSPSGTPQGAGLPTPEHGIIKNGRYFNTGKTYWPDGTLKFDFDARNATDPWFNGTISEDGFINDCD